MCKFIFPLLHFGQSWLGNWSPFLWVGVVTGVSASAVWWYNKMAYSSTRVFLINPPRSLSRRLYHVRTVSLNSLISRSVIVTRTTHYALKEYGKEREQDIKTHRDTARPMYYQCFHIHPVHSTLDTLDFTL